VKTTKDIVVFYSWQSILPDEANRNVIRCALRDASSRIENDLSDQKICIVLDEATRGESGSPNIPATILDKITEADVFICDITTVNQESTAIERKMPNPNVVFELGYAVSQIGWNRVILLFNKHFGTFPDEMPFDFDRHRASPYTYVAPEGKKTTKQLASLREPLVNLLQTAIYAIIENNPQKPFFAKEVTEEQKKRARDVSNLKWLMSTVHIPTLEMHIDSIPHKIHDRIFLFWEDFNAVTLSGLFHLYDKEMLRLVIEVREAWEGSLSFGHRYNSHPRRDVCFFATCMDLLSEEQQRDWDTIEKLRKQLNKSFRAILNYIHENYIEIDLNSLSSVAWDSYIQYKKKWIEELEEYSTIKDVD